MPKVNFTSALKQFFPGLTPSDFHGESLPELLSGINDTHPGFQAYILNEHGNLRQHVNIFVNGEMIRDLASAGKKLKPNDEVYILQALSGG